MSIKTKKLYQVRSGFGDMDLVVQHIRTEGKDVLRIGNFVPSIKREGYGCTLTVDALHGLIEVLQSAERYYHVGGGKPGPGQGSLL